MGSYDSGFLAKSAQCALDHFMRAGMGEQDQDIRRTDPFVHAALHFAEYLSFVSSLLTKLFILSLHAFITADNHNTHMLPQFCSLL